MKWWSVGWVHVRLDRDLVAAAGLSGGGAGLVCGCLADKEVAGGELLLSSSIVTQRTGSGLEDAAAAELRRCRLDFRPSLTSFLSSAEDAWAWGVKDHFWRQGFEGLCCFQGSSAGILVHFEN